MRTGISTLTAVSAVIDPLQKIITFTLNDGTTYTNPGIGSTHFDNNLMTHDRYYKSLVAIAKHECPDNITYSDSDNQELSAPIDPE